MFSCLTRGVAPDDPCRRYCGLKNQGATCHLNTVLQALYMTPEFRQGLLKLQPGELPPTGKAVCTVFAKMAHGNRTVSTKPLTSALRPVYVCTRQQDCHDTWLMLCDRLESDLKQTPLAKLVAQLFEGRQSDYVKCHKCATVTNTQDTFSNLSLAVPEEEEGASTSQDGDDDEDEEEEDGEETKTQKGDGEEQQQPAEAEEEDEAEEGTTNKRMSSEASTQFQHTVIRALRESLKPEQLRGEDQFMCDACKCKCDAERGVRYRTMPPIVSIHLKRFAIHTVKDRRGRAELNLCKVNTAVHFSRTLDLRPFVTPEPEGEDGKDKASADASSSSSSYADPPATAPPTAVDTPPHRQRPRTPAEVEMTSAASSANNGTPVAEPTGGGEGSGGGSGNEGDGGSGNSNTSSEPKIDEIVREGSLQYDLYAVLLHAGSLEKGHYFALIKDVADGSWYRFDDERVTHLSPEQLSRELKKAYGGRGSTSAYMLLYREVGIGGEGAAAMPGSLPQGEGEEDQASSPAQVAVKGKDVAL